jgi:hypothetical protein
MTTQQIIQEKEEKDKKKGLIITFFFHVILIALAFSPIMNAIEEMQKEETFIELVSAEDLKQTPPVEFVANAETKTRKNSSTKQESSPEVTPVPSKVTPEPEPTPQEVVEETLPTEVVEDVTAPVVTPSPVVKSTPVTHTPTKVETQPTTKTTNSTVKGSTTKTGGNATTDTHDSGDGGDAEDMSEGVFGRKVTYRPNIKGLTKQKGKIVIKVCVSQEGTVIATKYVQKLSTITDPKQVANAVRAARRYGFDVDYTSPKKQWGKLTFIFDLK